MALLYTVQVCSGFVFFFISDKQFKMSTPIATKSEAFDFEDFSDEVILKVVSFLDLNDRFKCYLTSKRLRAICQDHTLPSMWQKIHLYGPNLSFETSKNSEVGEFASNLFKRHKENYEQSTTWNWIQAYCYNSLPCENSQYYCGKLNNIQKQKTKGYLNLNIGKFDDESIKELLAKGCNFLLMTDILPTVGCALRKIFEEKDFPELREVAFTWCGGLPNTPSFPDHKHLCISLFDNWRKSTSIDCTCPKHEPVFIVHEKMPAKITTSSDQNLLGTTEFPIQLVQSGNDFRTLQNLKCLTPQRVVLIAKKLRQSKGIQDPSIIYEDRSLNRKFIYRFPNMNNARSVARNASAASVNSVALPKFYPI